MIYLHNTTGAQRLLIPRTVRVFAATGWALELYSQGRGKTAVFPGLTDAEDFRTYVSVDVDLAGQELATGEYTYTLYHAGGIVSRGLARIGDYKPERKTYQTERKLIEYEG